MANICTKARWNWYWFIFSCIKSYNARHCDYSNVEGVKIWRKEETRREEKRNEPRERNKPTSWIWINCGKNAMCTYIAHRQKKKTGDINLFALLHIVWILKLKAFHLVWFLQMSIAIDYTVCRLFVVYTPLHVVFAMCSILFSRVSFSGSEIGIVHIEESIYYISHIFL